MIELVYFLLIIGLLAFTISLIPLTISYYDRIVIVLMRWFGLKIYQDAVAIAVLIVKHPEQWSYDSFQMIHIDIGAIWIANSASGIVVKTSLGTWTPNFVERRIIRQAVDWRIKTFLRDRINNAVIKNLNAGLSNREHIIESSSEAS